MSIKFFGLVVSLVVSLVAGARIAEHEYECTAYSREQLCRRRMARFIQFLNGVSDENLNRAYGHIEREAGEPYYREKERLGIR